jgi:hypothetical protein
MNLLELFELCMRSYEPSNVLAMKALTTQMGEASLFIMLPLQNGLLIFLRKVEPPF